MNAPIYIHFGPTEIAHLAELQRTLPPSDLEPVTRHWACQSLWWYMKPLSSPVKPPGVLRRTPVEMVQLRNEYKEAVGTRGLFCVLFTGAAPFFLKVSPCEEECTETVCLAQSAIDQGNSQIESWRLGHENWGCLYNTLGGARSIVGSGESSFSVVNIQRPFIKLMASPCCAKLLLDYMKYVAARMAQSCRHNPGTSSPVVWLGFAHWHSLDFFDQARVVLAAKEYEEYVHRVVTNRALGLSGELVEKPWHMTAQPLHELGHVPSLTSRQARRSGVSRRELARRWA